MSLTLAGRALVRLVVTRVLGRKRSTFVGGAIALIAASVLVKKLSGYMIPGMAPADILAKTKSKVTGSTETMQSIEEGKDSPIVQLR